MMIGQLNLSYLILKEKIRMRNVKEITEKSVCIGKQTFIKPILNKKSLWKRQVNIQQESEKSLSLGLNENSDDHPQCEAFLTASEKPASHSTRTNSYEFT